jgi:hypothetical protein
VNGEEIGMELRVHKVAQAASGGSHVTIYEAEIDLAPGSVEVEILGVHPKDAFPDAVAAAREAIRRGAERVVQPRGLGAVIRVQRVVVHPVDFKPSKFALYTAEELTRVLEEGGEPGHGP